MKVCHITTVLNFDCNIELKDSFGETVLGGTYTISNSDAPNNDLLVKSRSFSSARSAKWFTNFNHELLSKIRNHEYINA